MQNAHQGDKEEQGQECISCMALLTYASEGTYYDLCAVGVFLYWYLFVHMIFQCHTCKS